MNYIVRLAQLSDIDKIKNVADNNRDTIGFVIRGSLIESIKKEWLLIEEHSGAFCNFRERKDGVTVIYEICVPIEYRMLGIGKMLIDKLKRPIMLKCPTDNDSNMFYEKLGFSLIDIVDGKKRRLNIWKLG